MLRRLVRWLAAALMLAAPVAYAVINLSGDDPAVWNRDPAAIALRGTPNEFLAAVPGTTAATPHLPTGIQPFRPRALLACFDRAARAAPRVSAVAGSLDGLMVTYVQRSRVIGFPDYITVRAVPQETGLPDGGAGLIVYSRSRYGHGDFGVNAGRVRAWLEATATSCQGAARP